MSYFPNQAMPNTLPFPANQLMTPFVQVDYQRPPVQPNVSYLPTELAPYYPMIVATCVDTLQQKAGLNPLRVFLYNQMAYNGYNNPDFTAFVEAVICFLDMRLARRIYQEIPSGVADAVAIFAELQAAANASKFPALAAQLDPQMIQGVNHVITKLREFTEEVSSHMQMVRQGGQRGFPQQPAFAQPPMMAPYGQPMQQPMQQPMAPTWPGAQQMQVPWQPAPVAQQPLMLGGSAVFGNGQSAGVATDPTARFSSRFSSPYDTQPPTRVAEVISPAQHVHEMWELKGQQNKPAPAAAPVATEELRIVKASDGLVKWNPSKEKPINIAYNPNTSDLYYRIELDGTTTPFIKEKEKEAMDINKHLVVPSYVKTPPVGTNTLDSTVRAFEMEKSIADDAAAIEKLRPLPLNVAYKDQSFNSGLSLDELWFTNEIKLATMRKKEGKANLYRSCSIVMEPVISEKNPKPFLDLLAGAESFSQACGMLKTANGLINTEGHPALDAKMLTFINTRLTRRVNDFLKKQLAVNNGWMDSFMEDAKDLIEFIERKYGESARKALVLNQKTMLRQALAYGEAEFEKEQNAFYFPEEDTTEGKEATALNVTYFYTYATFSSIDLFSTELKLEIPKSEVSVGIFEEQTPLVRHIVENIFTHQQVLGVEFGRHLLRTADNVVLEFTKSAMHSDFFLVTTA